MFFSSESGSKNEESWIWKMMKQDIKSKISPKEKQTSSQNAVRHSCDHCEYKAKTRQHLTTHIQAIHEGLRIACDMCGYAATSRPNLLRHKQRWHEGVVYSCDDCGHKSGSSTSLKYHINSVHTRENIFRCNECAYVSFDSGELRKHVKWVHLKSEDKSQKCDECAYICGRKTDMRKHVNRVHLKLFRKKASNICKHCDFASHTALELKRHMRTHNDGTFFVCN